MNATTRPHQNTTCRNGPDPNTIFEINARFALVVIGGGLVAIFGFFSSILLISILFKRKFRTTFCLYFAFLSCFDLLVLICYFSLTCVIKIYAYFNSIRIYTNLTYYVRPMNTLIRVTQLSQTLLVLAATTERCIETLRDKRASPRENRFHNAENLKVNKRYFIILAMGALAILIKGASFYEIQVTVNPECSGYSHIVIEEGSLARMPSYQWYKFYLEPLFIVYTPFAALFFMNIVIIIRLRNNYSQLNRSESVAVREPGNEHSSKVRSATVTMISLVVCYLVSNFLNLTITIMEQTSSPILTHHLKFYMFSTDISPILVTITCSVRIFVYALCNYQIRREIFRVPMIPTQSMKTDTKRKLQHRCLNNK